jgi:hypothetical protein
LSTCGVRSKFSKKELHQVISELFDRKISPTHMQQGVSLSSECFRIFDPASQDSI